MKNVEIAGKVNARGRKVLEGPGDEQQIELAEQTEKFIGSGERARCLQSTTHQNFLSGSIRYSSPVALSPLLFFHQTEYLEAEARDSENLCRRSNSDSDSDSDSEMQRIIYRKIRRYVFSLCKGNTCKESIHGILISITVSEGIRRKKREHRLKRRREAAGVWVR